MSEPTPSFADVVSKRCRASGMADDEPLAVLMVGFAEDRDAFRRDVQAAADVVTARGAAILTEQEKADLLRRVGQEAGRATTREVSNLANRLPMGLFAVSVVVAGLGRGIAGQIGRWMANSQSDELFEARVAARVEGIAGAAFLTQIAQLNNPSELRSYCDQHIRPTDTGGAKCTLPEVWVRAGTADKKAAAR